VLKLRRRWVAALLARRGWPSTLARVAGAAVDRARPPADGQWLALARAFVSSSGHWQLSVPAGVVGATTTMASSAPTAQLIQTCPCTVRACPRAQQEDSTRSIYCPRQRAGRSERQVKPYKEVRLRVEPAPLVARSSAPSHRRVICMYVLVEPAPVRLAAQDRHRGHHQRFIWSRGYGKTGTGLQPTAGAARINDQYRSFWTPSGVSSCGGTFRVADLLISSKFNRP